MVLAAGLELAKVGESLNYGARDLWEVSDSSNGESEVREGLKQQRHLSDEERMERWTVMFMTIGGLLAFKNDGVGFLAGMMCHGVYHSSKLWDEWRAQKVRNEGVGRDGRRSRQATTVEEEEGLLSET